MSEIRGEQFARELARTAADRTHLFDYVPAQLRDLIMETIVEASHDGYEAGEGAALASTGPTKLEHYILGYIHGINDRASGQAYEEGEQ